MSSYSKQILILIFLFQFFPILLAQHRGTHAKIENEYLLSNITINDGLSSNYITSIAKDKYGFLWIGTNEGLNRYDGIEFKLFKAEASNEDGLIDDKITCLYKNSSGRLWVGTSRGGLHYLNYFDDKFISLEAYAAEAHQLSSNGITSIVEDKNKNLWVGTNGGGLNLIDVKTNKVKYYFHNADDSNSLDNNFVTSLLVDIEGNLWIGTHTGLNRFNTENNSFVRYNLSSNQNKIPFGSIGVIHQDKSGILWLGTTFGLLNFNPQTNETKNWFRAEKSSQGFESGRVTAISDGAGGRLIVGTLSGELYNLDKNLSDETSQWQKIDIKSDDKLSINSFYTSSKNILWIGTSKGLVKYVQPKETFHKLNDRIAPQKLSSNYIWPIYEDSDGILWVGTIGGLNSYNPETKKIQQYIHDPQNSSSISDNSILTICEDSKKNIWIGTFLGGLNLFDKKSGEFSNWQFNSNDTTSLPNNLVGSIMEDRKGTIWIGTAAGIAQFDKTKNKVVRFNSPDDQNLLSKVYVSDMHEDINGNIWIATLRSGLILFNPDTGKLKQWLHNPEDKNSLSNNAIGNIIQIIDPDDNSKTLFILGTEGGGINIFDPETEKFTSYSEIDGLADNKISQIVVDENGIIWISSNNGLTMFDIVNKSFRIFDERDGIPDVNFNPWAGVKSRSGLIYFGSPKGIIYFDPEELTNEISLEGPDIVFTGFELFNKQIGVGEDSPLKKSIVETDLIELNHDDNIFSISFAALDFEKPEKNLYAYKIEGLRDEWIKIGTRNRVDFTGMDPGEYLFKVKAANSKGVWNDVGSQLKIIITPPFWQTWWFRFSIIILIAGLLYLAYRIRLNIILKEQETRNQIARDLHDDVSATLTGITWFAKAANKQKEDTDENEKQNFYKLIVDNATDAQEKIKDIIWAVQPELDTIDQLLAQCQRYAADVLESNNIQYTLDVPSSVSSKKIGMVRRQNFWLMYKEIIANAIKHSKCTLVDIKINIERNTLSLFIKDNGIGFEKDAVKTGNGLSNIFARAKKLNTVCSLDTKPGEGTVWQVHLDLK